MKSGKLVPLPFSSRHYGFKLKKWIFGKASDEEIAHMIERKVYWQTRLVGGDVWLGDPIQALYLDTTTDHIAESPPDLGRWTPDDGPAYARRYRADGSEGPFRIGDGLAFATGREARFRTRLRFGGRSA